MPLRPKSKEVVRYTEEDIDNSIFLSHKQKRLLQTQAKAAPPAPTWKDKLQQVTQDSHEWQAVLEPSKFNGESFRISDVELLRRASRQTAFDANFTVTSFSSWVHNLYAPEPTALSLSIGRLVDRELAKNRLELSTHGRWKIIYNGMGEERPPAYEVPSLAILGRSIFGAPDLVFREKRTGRILILEVKTTHLRIPRNAWPDVRAQLWAYSQIPEFDDAPEVLLRAAFYRTAPALERRCVIGWSKGDPNFDELSAQLFSLYKNGIERHEKWQKWVRKSE